MKRVAVWAFYGIGTLAILYLALSAYAAFTGRSLQPGDPIHIFRKPDAPKYSAVSGVAASLACLATTPVTTSSHRSRAAVILAGARGRDRQAAIGIFI